MIKLVLFAFIIAVGQLMFKRVSISLGDVQGLNMIALKLATDPLFILALMLYGSATILWVLALREVPLSIAYPFTALAFVLVPLHRRPSSTRRWVRAISSGWHLSSGAYGFWARA